MFNNAYILNKSASNPGALVLGTNNAERMRIDGTTGYLGIAAAGIFTTASGPQSMLDITKNAIAMSESDANGITLNNLTAAANNAQQFSPAIRWLGYGWKTTATAASQPVDFRSYVVPVQGAANPTGYLTFESNINGAGYTNLFNITSAGSVGIGTTNPTSSRLHIADSIVTTGNSILATSDSLTSGNLVSLQSTGSAAASNTQTVLNIATSGANNNQTTFGMQVSNSHSGTTTTNVAAQFNATNGTTANESIRVSPMSANTSTALNIQAMSGGVANTGVNIVSVAGGSTTNYGINIGAITGVNTATNTAINVAAMTGTGASVTGLNISKSSATGATNYGINIGGLNGAAATSNTGIYVASVDSSTATNYQINTAPITATAGASSYGISLGGATGTAAGSNNYGIKIGTINSTGTANYGLNILSPTGATHNSSLVIGNAVTTAGSWALYSADTNNSYFAGNVGIGTTAPAGTLDVEGGTAASGNGTSINIYAQNGNAAGMPTNGGNIVLMPGTGGSGGSSGNVGIGTAAPAGVLDVRGGTALTTGANGTPINIYAQNGNAGGSATNGGNIILMPGTKFGGGNDGNVGIGTTDPAGYKLNINGTGYLNSASWTYGSDRRLKENINYITEGGLDKIMQLKPASFDYINGDKNNLGFIAQDVQTVIPEAVAITNPVTGMLGLKTDFVIPYLVNGMQEQQTEISAQTENIVSLQLKTDTNITTFTGLQNSVDENLLLIQGKLDKIDQTQKQVQNNIDQINPEIAAVQTMQTKLQDQMDLIAAQAQAASDFITTLDVSNILYKDASGNLALGEGKITVKDIEASGDIIAKNIEAANNLKGNNLELSSDVSGVGEIKEGQLESDPILTKAVTSGAKIYITPKGSQSLFEHFIFPLGAKASGCPQSGTKFSSRLVPHHKITIRIFIAAIEHFSFL
jgi:hypothetical protein